MQHIPYASKAPQPPRPPPSTTRIWLTLAGLLIVVVGVAGFALYRQSRERAADEQRKAEFQELLRKFDAHTARIQRTGELELKVIRGTPLNEDEQIELRLLREEAAEARIEQLGKP